MTDARLHYCEHPGCKAWGSFGTGFGDKRRWFCQTHNSDRIRSYEASKGESE